MYKRALAIAIVLAIAGPFCIVTLYYCQFYHTLYRDTETEFSNFSHDVDWRLREVENRLGRLESHKPRHPVPTYVRGLISTTDVAPTGSWPQRSPTSTNEQTFEIVQDQNGLRIVPELRLQTGSTNEQVFDIHINPEIGTVTTGWLSHTEPYGELASLDQFYLYAHYDTRIWKPNMLHLRALAKPGKSVRMEFTTVILLER